MKILIVEDETGLQEALIDLLQGAGHVVEAVSDGESAVHRGIKGDHDLVLLDLMLPKLSGIEVARQLRAERPRLFILMLTARGAEDDKVEGLHAGADDYVTKPFAAKELLARVESFARRASARPSEIEEILVDGCHLDLGRCTAQRGGLPQEVVLTAREASILRWLHRHRARAVTRAQGTQRNGFGHGHRTVTVGVAGEDRWRD